MGNCPIPFAEHSGLYPLNLERGGSNDFMYINLDLTASNEDEEESKTEETTTCDTPGTPELLPKIDFKASNDTTTAAAAAWLRSCINEPSTSTLLSPFVAASTPASKPTGW